MSKLSEKEFKSLCQNKSFKNLYFIYGDEKFLVKQYTDYLLKKLDVDDENEFNYHKFFFENNIDEINSAVNIIPFMSDMNIVLVKDIDFDSIPKAQLNKLTELISDIPDTTILIISQCTVNSKSAAAFNNFVKKCEEKGNTLKLTKKSTDEISALIIKWAKKNDLILSTAQAKKIIEYASNDLNILYNEIEKLSFFCAGRAVTDQDIDFIISKNSEYNIFKLADYVIRGDMDSAYNQLDYLFYIKERPESILSILSSAYIDMYRVRLALESGYKSYNVADFFDYKRKEFRLEKAEINGRRISIQKLRDMICEIYKTDVKIKSISVPPRILIETLITNLLLIKSRVE